MLRHLIPCFFRGDGGDAASNIVFKGASELTAKVWEPPLDVVDMLNRLKVWASIG